MKKVGEGTIPMPYDLWKEMSDCVERAKESFRRMTEVKELDDKLTGFIAGDTSKEAMDLKQDYLARTVMYYKAKESLEDMESRLSKYYSFEP